MDKTYTINEIEEMLQLPCCHVSGTHDPCHYKERKGICNIQIGKAFENLCRKLKINPKVKHKETCGWCEKYPKYKKGDGKEYWDQPNHCAKCGELEMYHKDKRDFACEKFIPCSFNEIKKQDAKRSK